MTMMNITVVLSSILAIASGEIDDECRNVCTDVKRAASFKTGCSVFRNSLPKPKVARYCQDSFRAAIDANCYDACINGGRARSFLADRRLDETCYGALQKTPRPLCHDSCVHGYRSGLKEMSAILVTRIPKAGKAGADADSLQSTSNGESNVQAPKDSERQVEYEEGQHPEESADNAAFDVDWVDELNGIPDPTNDGSTTLSLDDLENLTDLVNEEEDLAILLPITIDGEQKELTIYENDDPTDVVLAFCVKNMPDEVADCVDDLLGSVQDTLTVNTEDVKVIAE